MPKARTTSFGPSCGCPRRRELLPRMRRAWLHPHDTTQCWHRLFYGPWARLRSGLPFGRPQRPLSPRWSVSVSHAVCIIPATLNEDRDPLLGHILDVAKHAACGLGARWGVNVQFQMPLEECLNPETLRQVLEKWNVPNVIENTFVWELVSPYNDSYLESHENL